MKIFITKQQILSAYGEMMVSAGSGLIIEGEPVDQKIENKDAYWEKLLIERDEEIKKLKIRCQEEEKWKNHARGESEAYMEVIEKLISKLKGG